MFHRAAWPALPRRGRTAGLALVLALVAACSRNPQPDDEIDFRRDPVVVHVTNENFLDMNVAVISSGVSRRLGQVSGNGSANFTVAWSVVNGQQIQLTATPIGGRGSFRSIGLSVGSGQMVELHIGTVLAQSSAAVRETM